MKKDKHLCCTRWASERPAARGQCAGLRLTLGLSVNTSQHHDQSCRQGQQHRCTNCMTRLTSSGHPWQAGQERLNQQGLSQLLQRPTFRAPPALAGSAAPPSSQPSDSRAEAAAGRLSCAQRGGGPRGRAQQPHGGEGKSQAHRGRGWGPLCHQILCWASFQPGELFPSISKQISPNPHPSRACHVILLFRLIFYASCNATCRIVCLERTDSQLHVKP